jgi:ATP-dependent DNA helicase RecG
MIYGDLDISVISQLPKGRQPVKTYAVTGKKRADAFGFVRKLIDEGRQAYVVCPMIETNEKAPELKSVEVVSKEYKDYLEPYGVRIATLTGKTGAEETEETINRFKNGDVDVLIATTVIEVGVNVPNATVMVIADADQYGLSQLHQLRGRVGRGSAASYCYLINSTSDNPTRRLREIEHSQDGFYLAEVDLKLRGPGEIYGALQHGAMDLRIASITDTKLIHQADKLVKDFRKNAYDMLEYKELSATVHKYQRLTTLN